MKKAAVKVAQLGSRPGSPSSLTFDSDQSVGREKTIIPPAGHGRQKLTQAPGHVGKVGVPYGRGDMVHTQPIRWPLPLAAYEYDPALAQDECVIVTVKTTLQLHRNLRQEEQQCRPRSDIFGRERARRYVYGLVAAFSLSHDRFDWGLSRSDWAFSALEPYAVAVHGHKMALAGGSYVRLIDIYTGEETPCQHPWLSQVHSVQFSADGGKLLVASSGFDAVFEFDTRTGNVSWEWFAWEHGFDRSLLGHFVVRIPERKDALAAIGQDAFLVDEPSNFEFGVATRLIPSHLNSALYDADGRILVSLFHQGTGVIIDKATGNSQEVISGLINPHKFSRARVGGYFISDTRRGRLVLVDDRFRVSNEITLEGLPGVERSHLLSEFLQNTTELKDGLFACVDIHRNSLWLVDVMRRRYRGIKFPREWSMHDVAGIGREQLSRIGQLVGTAFGKIEALSEEEGHIIRHYSESGKEVETWRFDMQGRAIGLDVEM